MQKKEGKKQCLLVSSIHAGSGVLAHWWFFTEKGSSLFLLKLDEYCLVHIK